MKLSEIDLEHLSPSSINMFLRCPAQWYFRYVEGLIQAPAAVMVLGRSVDRALDSNYQYKIKNKDDKSLEEVLDVYSDTWEEEKEEIIWKEDEKPGIVKDNGVRVITMYHSEIAPIIKPVESQRKISLDIPGLEIPVIGYIDLISEGNIVIDNKVKGATPSKNKTGLPQPTADERVQMVVYEHGLLQENIEPKGVQLDVMVTTKTPQIHRIPVDTTMDDLMFVYNISKTIVKAINAEVFLPNRGSFMCSQRNCGFWENCQKLYGGVVKD